MDTVTCTGPDSKVFQSRVMSTSTLSAGMSSEIHCVPPSLGLLKSGSMGRSFAGTAGQSRFLGFFLPGRYHVCVTGSDGSMRHCLSRNLRRCERVSIVGDHSAMKFGPRKSQNGTDCGTRCVQSDAPKRSRSSRNEKCIGFITPVTFFAPGNETTNEFCKLKMHVGNVGNDKVKEPKRQRPTSEPILFLRRKWWVYMAIAI